MYELSSIIQPYNNNQPHRYKHLPHKTALTMKTNNHERLKHTKQLARLLIRNQARDHRLGPGTNPAGETRDYGIHRPRSVLMMYCEEHCDRQMSLWGKRDKVDRCSDAFRGFYSENEESFMRGQPKRTRGEVQFLNAKWKKNFKAIITFTEAFEIVVQ